MFQNKKNPKYKFHKSSLKTRLLYTFLATSVIPLIISSFFSYYNSSKIVKANTDELTTTNLQQTRDSLDIWLDSYEDLLYQMYTDDNIIALVDKLNDGDDLPVTVNQLRRTLRGLLNTKDYLRSITIFTENGSIVTYNKLTAVTTEDAWIDNFSLSQGELYNIVSKDNKTHILGTEYGVTFAAEDYYLFHLAHRMVNYKQLEKRSAIVVISIDEKLLQKVCQNEEKSDVNNEKINFIVDDSGNVVSFIDPTKIGTKIDIEGCTTKEKEVKYKEFIDDSQAFNRQDSKIYICHDDTLGWDIINVSNQNEIIDKLKIQRNILTIATLVSILFIIGIIIFLTAQLTSSIRKVIVAMATAGKGDLSVRIEKDSKMPVEIEIIADQFNETLEKLKEASENEKEAEVKQRQAEIKALEAQINPHFLYNTLDTINWMAIDRNEFEISNAISSLATILRYAIDNSNGIVKVREEAEWLKKYIFLQQTRLKNTFKCDIHVDQEAYEVRIHKLLLQPFIENAILHGFEGSKKTHLLDISIKLSEDFIKIVIRDNGNGIEEKRINEMNHLVFRKTSDKNHIGMENAITRIHMYYGERAKIQINSVYQEGTEIIIDIPIEKSEDEL